MAEPQTKVIGGDGSSTLEYELAPGVFQYIESVRIDVDTSGSGDVQPTLEVRTQDDVPIATKEQDDAITGGGSGSATWALRLSGNGRSNTLGLHWGTNTDTTGLGLLLDTLQSIRANAANGLTLTGDNGSSGTGNQVVIEPEALGAVQRVLVRILQGFFEITRGLTDVRVFRLSDTGFAELNIAQLLVNNTAGNGLFGVVSGAGAGTGTSVSLNNGSQFRVFDHNGAPMVTYTG